MIKYLRDYRHLASTAPRSEEIDGALWSTVTDGGVRLLMDAARVGDFCLDGRNACESPLLSDGPSWNEAGDPDGDLIQLGEQSRPSHIVN